MKWLTQDEIASAKNAKDAMDLTLKHWHQISYASPKNLRDGYANGLWGKGTIWCGLCQYYRTICQACPIGGCYNGNHYWNLRWIPKWDDPLFKWCEWQSLTKVFYKYLKGLK